MTPQEAYRKGQLDMRKRAWREFFAKANHQWERKHWITWLPIKPLPKRVKP